MKRNVFAAANLLLTNERDDEECDATDDAMKNYSWVNNREVSSKRVMQIVKTIASSRLTRNKKLKTSNHLIFAPYE